MTHNVDSSSSSQALPTWWPYAAHGWLLLAVLTTLGCAGAGSQVTPGSSEPAVTALPGPIMTGPASVTAPLGLFRLTADPATGAARLTPIPVRSGTTFATGDSVIPDLTTLFTDPAGLCGECLTLAGVGYDPVADEIWFDVNVTHPIPSGRPELSAFDMQLLLVSDLPSQPVLTFPGTGGATAHPRYLTNAEGHTNQLTASLEAALGTPLSVDLFPFINVAVDDTVGNFAGSNVNGFADVAAPTGHNVFSSGESDTVQLRLDASGFTSIDMVLALSGSFYRSYSTKGSLLFQKNNPVYFAPEGNRKEAWRVLAEVRGSALKSGDASSVAMLDLAIRDWQHGLPAQGVSWNPLEPLPANQSRDAIPETSDVASITIEIPGVTTSPVDVTALPHAGDGRTTPLLYSSIQIANSASASAGSYAGLVRVRDSRATEIAGPGEGDVLFQDGATFGGLAAFDTYAIFEVEVADDYVFVGNDLSNTGTRIARTGAAVTATGNYFTGVGATVSNAAIDGNAVYVVSSGPAFSGNGRVQHFNLASGDLECEYVFGAGENPFDLALLGNDEVYVTGFLSDDIYRINLDPVFAGTRLTNTIDLSPYADPGYLARPQEIHTMSGGRIFASGAHLSAGFTAAPAGLLFELNPATNAVVQAVDTTGLRNCWSLAEYPGGTSLGVFGPGTYAGDGGSGRFNLGTNTWTVDPFPPGLAWTECGFTSTGRVFLSDAFVGTLAHIGLPFTGTINHQIDVLPPPVPPFPFISSVEVGRGDFLYAGEFNGTLRVWDASVASATTPPTVIDTLTIPGGVDAIGVQE